ncbi:MAG TPA: YciI family protein [Micromonosporaceae bacterium]|nr:YciI family protein [Micromonosporaceae bacterium]
MRYAMLINGVEADWHDASPEQRASAMAQIERWFERWSAAGKIGPGNAQLDLASTAKTIRPGPDGELVVTDGPYIELKEVIGGVIMLNADSIDEAVEIAKGWPTLLGMSSVEVRPTVEM